MSKQEVQLEIIKLARAEVDAMISPRLCGKAYELQFWKRVRVYDDFVNKGIFPLADND